MSVTILCPIENRAEPGLRALYALAGNRQYINQYVADAAADVVRTRFLDLENGAHKSAERLGATPTGFWANMRSGVRARATESAGTVAMPRQVALHYFGGTLTPQSGQTYLTIAAIAAAYGHRAREFPQLEFGMAKNQWGTMQPALVERPHTPIRQTRDRRKGAAAGATRIKAGQTNAGGTVYFWLTRSVTIKPDKSVLPTDEQLGAAARTGIAEAVQSILNQAGGQN